MKLIDLVNSNQRKVLYSLKEGDTIELEGGTLTVVENRLFGTVKGAKLVKEAKNLIRLRKLNGAFKNSTVIVRLAFMPLGNSKLWTGQYLLLDGHVYRVFSSKDGVVTVSTQGDLGMEVSEQDLRDRSFVY